MESRFKCKKIKFTQISNSVLMNEKLSLKSKGLYSLIQHYITIPNFILYKNTLLKKCKEKESAFNTAWKELKDEGYLIQDKKTDGKGHFFYEYELLDEPTPLLSTHGLSIPGKMGVYNNTDLSNTDLSNTKKDITGFTPEKTEKTRVVFDKIKNQLGSEYENYIDIFISHYKNKTGYDKHFKLSDEDIPYIQQSFEYLYESNILVRSIIESYFKQDRKYYSLQGCFNHKYIKMILLKDELIGVDEVFDCDGEFIDEY